MRIGFYHMTLSRLDQALPQLTGKAYAASHRILILARSEERARHVNALLWSWEPDSWLPHGSKDDPYPEQQPIYVAYGPENPNQATLLIMVDGAEPDGFGGFERCLNLFDGNDETALVRARDQWSRWRKDGHELIYHQQGETGGWREKTRTSGA